MMELFKGPLLVGLDRICKLCNTDQVSVLPQLHATTCEPSEARYLDRKRRRRVLARHVYDHREAYLVLQ
jgi:hypothetical protein